MPALFLVTGNGHPDITINAFPPFTSDTSVVGIDTLSVVAVIAIIIVAAVVVAVVIFVVVAVTVVFALSLVTSLFTDVCVSS